MSVVDYPSGTVTVYNDEARVVMLGVPDWSVANSIGGRTLPNQGG